MKNLAASILMLSIILSSCSSRKQYQYMEILEREDLTGDTVIVEGRRAVVTAYSEDDAFFGGLRKFERSHRIEEDSIENFGSLKIKTLGFKLLSTKGTELTPSEHGSGVLLEEIVIDGKIYYRQNSRNSESDSKSNSNSNLKDKSAKTITYKNNLERVLIGFGKSEEYIPSLVDFTISNSGNGEYKIIYTDRIGDLTYSFTYANKQVEGWYYYVYKSSLATIELASENKLSEIANGSGGKIAWVHKSEFDTRSVLYVLSE